MANVVEVAENIYMIDDQLYSIPQAGSVYFLDEDHKALVDTGPATSSQAVIEGIKKIGRKSADVSFIIISHIHLDHSGGVGTLLESMPQAEVVAHHKAVKHIVNPEKLVKSALEAQGDAWMIMNGAVVPVDTHKVKPAFDGDKITLGSGQVLTLLETPGHAPHELSIYESRNGGVFVGDAVAHHVAGTDISVPITPPPSFDLDLYLNSLNKLMNIATGRLYFAHSGVSNKVAEKINLAVNELKIRNEIIARAVEENKTDTAFEMVMNHERAVLNPVSETMKELVDYWMNFDIPMSVREHVKYYLKNMNLVRPTGRTI
jgi:glyoxylase-like metal-dependent hydrolase (beta-lactamase superfamily II)